MASVTTSTGIEIILEVLAQLTNSAQVCCNTQSYELFVRTARHDAGCDFGQDTPKGYEQRIMQNLEERVRN